MKKTNLELFTLIVAKHKELLELINNSSSAIIIVSSTTKYTPQLVEIFAILTDLSMLVAQVSLEVDKNGEAAKISTYLEKYTTLNFQASKAICTLANIGREMKP